MFLARIVVMTLILQTNLHQRPSEHSYQNHSIADIQRGILCRGFVILLRSSGPVQLFMFFWRRLSGFGACGADGKGEPKRFSRRDAESAEGRAAHRDGSPYPRGSFLRFGSGRIGGDTSPYLGAGISDVGETKEEGREQGCSRYYGESCCG